MVKTVVVKDREYVKLSEIPPRAPFIYQDANDVDCVAFVIDKSDDGIQCLIISSGDENTLHLVRWAPTVLVERCSVWITARRLITRTDDY